MSWQHPVHIFDTSYGDDICMSSQAKCTKPSTRNEVGLVHLACEDEEILKINILGVLYYCDLIRVYNFKPSYAWVLWQTVKTQMKCRLRVYTVCYDKNNLRRKKCNFYLEIIACDPLIYKLDHPVFIASNHKEEAISA